MAIAVRAEYELTGLGDAFFAWLEDLLAQERYLVQKGAQGQSAGDGSSRADF